jgi:DNA primase
MRAKCHNCQYSAPFYIFLKEFDQNMFKEYTFEKFKTKKAKPPRKHLKEIVPEKEKIAPGYDYADAIDFESLSKTHPARKYVEDRKIPLELVLYAPFYGKFLEDVHFRGLFTKCEQAEKMYKNKEPRMIIPFYDENGQSYVFQARSFDPNSKLKYITTKVDEKYPKIYGMDRVNWKEPVIVVEGPIDSMLLDNCIAMSGASLSLPVGPEYIFVFDAEPRNRDIVNAMERRLEQGHKVFVPPKSWKANDINEMIVKYGITPKFVRDMIFKMSYSGLYGTMMLNKWKRV